MKTLIFNEHNLNDSDILNTIIRVKALIINSKGEILIVQNNNTYQFPGGHLENTDTSIDNALIREVKEEVGIDIKPKEKPFLCIKTYDDNYFNTGKKVLNIIYYYQVLTDSLPDFTKTQYDELELKTEFNIFYIKFNKLEPFLKKNLLFGNIDSSIEKEMIQVIHTYKEIYGG